MLSLRKLLITFAVLAVLGVLATVFVGPAVTRAGGDLPVGTAVTAGTGGLVIDGRGPLYAAPLGPVDAMYAECTALPCVVWIETGGRRTFLIIGQPAPRG